jgi:hypothetical protein
LDVESREFGLLDSFPDSEPPVDVDEEDDEGKLSRRLSDPEADLTAI